MIKPPTPDPLPLHRRLEAFAEGPVGPVRFAEPLANHTSWQIGGPAALLVEPANSQQIAEVLRRVRHYHLPLVVIGQGTNLLFDDAGVLGVVLKVGEHLADIQIDGERISAGGGAWVPQLARRSMRAGLTGLEHCIGIPGTLGGLVMMNGGSQRRGIGENVTGVEIVDTNGQVRTLKSEECDFGYRHSALQGSGCVITRVELLCPAGKKQQVRQQMIADLRSRRQKFPRKLPNCGSVFLSTGAMHASVGPPGRIIEETGLKGARIGQAEVSRQHANFIVNLGGARALDILELIARIRRIVLQRIGFELQCEVRHVSPLGEVTPAHLEANRLFGHPDEDRNSTSGLSSRIGSGP